ncbi:MAG: putative tellurite resistance protein B-like protein [Myxococcota bacterium]|jgi:uncharacterized tellurite resistance protein B-like protein
MSNFDDHQLKLALAHHLVETVVTADGNVTDGEKRYMDLLFPISVMEAEGFCDDGGMLTAMLDEARRAALQSLPSRMALADKHELLTMCIDAALADDQADAYELVHVRVAAAILDVGDDELDTFLATLPTVGEVCADDLMDDDA